MGCRNILNSPRTSSEVEYSNNGTETSQHVMKYDQGQEGKLVAWYQGKILNVSSCSIKSKLLFPATNYNLEKTIVTLHSISVSK